VAQTSRKQNQKVLIRVYRQGSSVGHWGGPGRAGPAMAGFFVEPRPLDFWKLEKSLLRTPTPKLIDCPRYLKRFVKKIRYLVPPAISPYRRYAYFTVLAFLVIPPDQLSETLSQTEKRSQLAQSVCHENDGFMIVAVIQNARRPHSRSESPEILGRIVFFITAVGRSPPPRC
jgi:hypothetical protein